MKHILIVDDIEDVRSGLADIFSDEGYQVSQSSNGADAIDFIRKNEIDILITDILMPEMDGIELVKAAKEVLPNLKSVAISGGGRQLQSGSNTDYLQQSKVLAGVDQILKKPFKPEEIIQLVSSLYLDD